jgi:hypothetical protein
MHEVLIVPGSIWPGKSHRIFEPRLSDASSSVMSERQICEPQISVRMILRIEIKPRIFECNVWVAAVLLCAAPDRGCHCRREGELTIAEWKRKRHFLMPPGSSSCDGARALSRATRRRRRLFESGCSWREADSGLTRRDFNRGDTVNRFRARAAAVAFAAAA